jgi:hypothetical protein
MAFSSTRNFCGYPRLRFATGTFTNGATDVGGTIDTGLKHVYFATVNVGSHIGSEQIKLTWSGSTLTLVTDEGADGYWFAVGF